MNKEPPTYITRVTQLTVMPQNDPTFSEMATTINIDDEGGGEFVVVEQSGRADLGKIAVTPEEWPTLREAINRMIAECKGVA